MFRKYRFLFSIAEEVEPKWKKFFQSQNTMQVNTERSLKNDASESLNYYVKQNFRTFSPEILVQAYQKRDLSFDLQRLLQYEFIDRIIEEKLNLKKETLLTLFDKDLQNMNYNSIIATYLLLQGLPIFSELTISQQTYYMMLAFRVGCINPKLYKQFLSNLKIDDAYFDSLSLVYYKCFFKYFDMSMKSPYDLGLPAGFIDAFVNKYLQRLNDFEGVAKEIMKSDFSDLMINFKPSYLSAEQLQEIKIAYARILNKVTNKNNSFLFARQPNLKDVLPKIFSLYDQNDYHLVQRALCILLQNKQEKQDFMIHQISRHFKIFPPSFYFNLLKVCQRTYFGSSINKFDTRSIYYFLTSNAQAGFLSIMKESSEITEALNNITKQLISFVQTVNEDDLLNFSDVFSTEMEIEISSEVSSSEYSETASDMMDNLYRGKKETDVRKIMDKIVLKIEEFNKAMDQKEFQKFYYIRNNKKVFNMDSLFIFIESLSFLSFLQPDMEINTQVFKSSNFLLMLQNLLFIPQLFDQILFIYNAWPKLFNQEITAYILEAKANLDRHYNEAESPQGLVDSIERELEELKVTFVKGGKFLQTRQCHTSFQTFNFMKQQPHHKVSPDLKSPFDEYTILETYCNNRRNMLITLAYKSDLVVQHTHFKELIWQALQLDSEAWKMNYSDYPHLVDFICEKQKIVVMLEEYPRLIRGLSKVKTYETELAEKHFTRKGYSFARVAQNFEIKICVSLQLMNEPTVPCSNCKQQIAESKSVLHEIYCLRNNVKCNKCGIFYDKNDPESHEEEYHKKQTCPFCKQDFDDLSRHKCAKKPKQCLYCDLQFTQDQLFSHENQCGSRTEKCNVCGAYVMIRELSSHQISCIPKARVEAPVIQNKPAQQEIYDKPASKFDDNYDQQKYNSKLSRDTPTQFQPQQNQHKPPQTGFKYGDAKSESRPIYQSQRSTQEAREKEKIQVEKKDKPERPSYEPNKPGSSSGTRQHLSSSSGARQQANQQQQYTSKSGNAVQNTNPPQTNSTQSRNSYLTSTTNQKQESTQFDNVFEKNKYQQNKQSYQPPQQPQQQPPPQQAPQSRFQRPLESYKQSTQNNVPVVQKPPQQELKRPDTAIARDIQQQYDLEAMGMSQEEMLHQQMLMEQIEQQKNTKNSNQQPSTKQQPIVPAKYQPQPQPSRQPQIQPTQSTKQQPVEDDFSAFMTEEEKLEQQQLFESLKSENRKYK